MVRMTLRMDGDSTTYSIPDWAVAEWVNFAQRCGFAIELVRED